MPTMLIAKAALVHVLVICGWAQFHVVRTGVCADLKAVEVDMSF